MNANELGNKYFEECIRLNASGPYCRKPFYKIRYDQEEKFVNLLLEREILEHNYEMAGIENKELEDDWLDLRLSSRIYQNEDFIIGVYYKTILIFDGKHYIKTDNFNEKDSWYFCY